jgi:predicted phosphodiesterase
MRVAIISDIHGNAVGLEAALADLKPGDYDQMVCLGDAIQGGPQPAEVARRLRDLNIPVVMGNADAWLMTGIETGKEHTTEKQLAVREWMLTQLSGDDIAFVRTFRPTVTVDLGKGQTLLCFHGSPASFDDIILPETPEDDVQRCLGPHKSSFLTGGHTHLQFIRRMGDTFFFNPGSIGIAYFHGQPEDSMKLDHWAEYAILSVDGANVRLEFRRAPYDVKALIAVYQSSRRPYAGDMIREYTR